MRNDWLTKLLLIVAMTSTAGCWEVPARDRPPVTVEPPDAIWFEMADRGYSDDDIREVKGRIDNLDLPTTREQVYSALGLERGRLMPGPALGEGEPRGRWRQWDVDFLSPEKALILELRLNKGDLQVHRIWLTAISELRE
jgi:hypothetical protein